LVQLKSSATDLLLLDYAMPGMNGAEVAAQARALRPDVRLLFLSGYADSEAIQQAVGGEARILRKPISASDLAAAIDEMLT
jgi:CheY-like chemotaxis protein